MKKLTKDELVDCICRYMQEIQADPHDGTIALLEVALASLRAAGVDGKDVRKLYEDMWAHMVKHVRPVSARLDDPPS